MKSYLTLFVLALIATSCAPLPTGGSNPLDLPGDDRTAAQRHRDNIAAITSNPGYQQR